MIINTSKYSVLQQQKKRSRYRSVTPLDAARVNRTIFQNHSVHRYYITLIEGRDHIKHDIII